MATKLPTNIVSGAPRGGRASTATPPATDYGLGDAAKAIGQVAQALDRRADDDAKQALVEARTQFDPGFADAAERYDGLAPGFAQGQVQGYDAATDAARARLHPDAQRKFDRMRLDDRLSVVDRASGIEARASGAIEARQRAAEQDTRVTATAVEHKVETQGALRDAFAAGDPTAADFAPGQLAAFDERAQARLEAAREEDRPVLQRQFANQRADLAIGLAAASRGLLDARVLESAKAGLKALENGVVGDPSTLPGALREAQTLLTGLPPDVREKMERAAASDLTAASLRGLVDREDWHGVEAKLEDPTVKATLSPEAYAQFKGRATQVLTSQQRKLAADTVGRRLESELASLRETGQGTGFDPAAAAVQVFGPLEGPVKALEWRQAIADARTVHEITYDFAALPAADQQARLALIKPAAGDKDFAHKQAVYEQALKAGLAQAQLRQTDPAQALMADKTAQALWLQAQDGDPAHAKAWAADALARQTALGIGAEAQRILPAAEAKRVVGLTQGKDAAGKADALIGAYAYAARFGDQGGRVLYELQRAGLPTEEAAVLNAVDADPVVVGAFARAQARLPTVKLDKGDKEKIEAQVSRAISPLTRTYAASAEGQAYADGLTRAVTTLATAAVGDGKDAREAAEDAARWFMTRFHIDAKTGWRLPAAVASRRDVPVTDQPLYVAGPVTGRGDGALAVRTGAQHVLKDVIADGGAALRPRGPEAYLTDAQKRARLADLAAKDGRWVTTEDDGGLMLMLPDPRAGLTPVLDKAGKPIVRTWDQLISRAGRP